MMHFLQHPLHSHHTAQVKNRFSQRSPVTQSIPGDTAMLKETGLNLHRVQSTFKSGPTSQHIRIRVNGNHISVHLLFRITNRISYAY